MSILVVAAHADDEVLGCGGTIARHTAAGDKVHVLFLADGETGRDAVCDPVARREDIKRREEAARAAARILGAAVPEFCRFPDNRCDGVPLLDIVKAVERIIAKVRPAVMYTHHANDLNVDHRIAHQAVLTAGRPVAESPVREIYAFETASSTEWEASSQGRMFQPARFVNIEPFIEVKLAALAAYGAEMREFPHPRSRQALEAQWMLRGAQSGLPAAEAFVAVREICR